MLWKKIFSWVLVLGISLLQPLLNVFNDHGLAEDIFIALFVGFFVYILFNWSCTDKKALFFSGISFVLNLIVSLILTTILIDLNNKLADLQNSMASPESGVLLLFQTHSLSDPVIFFIALLVMPLIIYFIKKKEYTGMFKKSPWICLIYNIFTLNIYTIYWFYFAKKNFKIMNIELPSLWLFLIPVFGPIIIYLEFSKAFARITRFNSSMWFLIMFLLIGINIPIMQAILNDEMIYQSEQNSLVNS